MISTLSAFIVTTLLVLTNVAFASPQSNQEAREIEVRQSVLTEALKSSEPIEKNIAAQLSGQPEVIFLGELHEFGAGRYGYHHLLETFNRNLEKPIDCITLEYNSQWKEEFIEVLHGELSLQALEKKAQKEIAIWQELFSFASENKIPVYPVDWDSTEWNNAFDKAWDSLSDDPTALDNLPSRPSIEVRNQIMFTNITKLLSAGKCTKVVHLSGANHFSTANPKDSLQSMIESPTIQTVSFNLQPLKPFFYFGPYPTILNWPKASWNPQLKKEEFAFENPQSDEIMYPNGRKDNSAIPRWSSFNATLFFAPPKK